MARTIYLLVVQLFSLVVLQVANAGVPAVFIFGDSTADVGNNNFLSSKAKANFFPYGIDFVLSQATGRFSNGLNTADFLAKLMGFKRSPPPFLSLLRTKDWGKAKTGINFASAGSGLIENTGAVYGQHLSMDKQVEYFKMFSAKLTGGGQFLSKSIFVISTGSNDFFDNFAANGSMNETTRSAFVATLISAYRCQITALYKAGARKFGIISIPPIGCCPAFRDQLPNGICLGDLNFSAQKFYIELEAMLKDLSLQLHGMKYSLGNTYEMVYNFFVNPKLFGFTELKVACCGGESNGKASPCLPSSSFCPNRNQYLFWDMFHPSQAASKLAGQTLFYGSEKFVTPINLSQLVAL